MNLAALNLSSTEHIVDTTDFALDCDFIVETDGGKMVAITGKRLIDTIDMQDCFNPFIASEHDDPKNRWNRVWKIVDGEWHSMNVHGAWHDSNDPLYIKIVDQKTGKVVLDGHGTDH